MNLRDLIADFDGRLTKADQNLISVLFSAPAEGTYLRARDLAARAAGGAVEQGAEKWVFLGVGLLATIIVTAVVTRIARKALKEATNE